MLLKSFLKIYKKKYFILLFLTFYFLQHMVFCFAGENIVKTLERYDNGKMNNPLFYGQAYDVISSASVAKLNVLKKNLPFFRFQQLHHLIDQYQSQQMTDYFPRQEDFEIFHTPHFYQTPFLPSEGQKPMIQSFDARSEHVYFNNLYLNFTKSDLKRINESLWSNIADDALKINKKNVKGSKDKLRKNVLSKKKWQSKEQWRFVIPSITRFNYFFEWQDRRQWLKEYEEKHVRPLIYDATVIFRNEDRIFGLEEKTGMLKWTFSVQRPEERYTTSRPPHHNHQNQSFSIDKDVLFAELGGSLVALEFRPSSTPKLLWKKSLGEYTTVTDPIPVKNKMVIGLINARGELWFVGFNKRDGDFLWRQYVGLSSYLSPLSHNFLYRDGIIYIGTNHGFLIALHSHDGTILWIRKVPQRTYNIFDYYDLKYFKGMPVDKKKVEYDTALLFWTDEQTLCYKAREAEKVFFVDARTGALRRKFGVDYQKNYFLGAFGSALVFFERPETFKPSDILEMFSVFGGVGAAYIADSTRFIQKGKSKIHIVDIMNPDNVITQNAKGDSLEGVIPCQDKIFFKTNANRIYQVAKDEDGVNIESFPVRDGWLCGVQNQTAFIEEDGELSNYSFAHPSVLKNMQSNQNIVVSFFSLLNYGDQSDSFEKQLRKLTAHLKKNRLAVEYIAPFIVQYSDHLHGPQFEGLLTAISERSKDTVVSYRGINILLQNFMQKKGLIPDLTNKSQEDALFRNTELQGLVDYEVKGEELSFVPIETVGSDKRLDFYLLSTFNQLLCIQESGEIKWERKFFEPKKAFLLNDVLIINDRFNIVALHKSSGEFLWSYSQRLYKNGYVNSDLLDILFVGETVLIADGMEIRLSDPLTGFVDQPIKRLPSELLSISYNKKKIVCTTKEMILVYSDDFSVSNSFPFPALIKEQKIAQVLLAETCLFFRTKDHVVGVSLVDGSIIMDRKADSNTELILTKNRMVLFNPFSKIISFTCDSEKITVAWEQDYHPNTYSASDNKDDKKTLWRNYSLAEGTYCCVMGDDLFLPVFEKQSLYLVRIDGITGKTLWRKKLEHIQGLCGGLGPILKRDNRIIIFVAEIFREYLAYREKNDSFPAMVEITPHLYELVFDTGDIIDSKTLMPTNFFLRYMPLLAEQTINYIYYLVHGQFLFAKGQIQ